MKAGDPALQHLAQLQDLLIDLRSRGIALYVHQYDALAFGSFLVVLGTSHRRIRFCWDGKESSLEVSCQEAQNQSENAPWIHDAYISLPGGEGVYAEIASEAVSVLA